MQLVIDIPEDDYKFIKDLQFYNSGIRSGRTIEQNVINGIRNGKPYDERPQGEWIRTGSLGNGNAQYECSNCHYGDEQAESQEVPYCWHCGAEMQKGGSE